ncbi:MAG TPA: DUF5050 domain-containing protein [Niabella sp.]|nr:DUF5050 domain-containing protein [Niabella sp.]
MHKLLPAFLLVLIIAGCKKEKYDFDSLPDTVKSFYTFKNTKLLIDEPIQFNNESENAETYTWDFGDGTKSNEKNPNKTYKNPGTYTVLLKAVGNGGTGNYSKDLVVIDPNAVTNADKEMYFIEYGAKFIKKISLDPGSVAENVVSIADKRGVSIAYDVKNKKIYYTDFEDSDDGKIWRMNLDGSNMEALVSGITDPYAVAINLKGGKIYWADDDGNVSRANLDGSNVEKEFIHIADGQMRALAYNSKTDVLYFYEVNNEDLYSAKSDGSGVGKIIEGAYGYGMFVDEINDKIYYEDRNKPAIMRANLDGSGIVKIADAPGTRVHGMAIDYSSNKFYWADRDKSVIRRANLDGTGAETFLSGLSNPRGIFIKNKE